jgi:hypothetical protein
MDFDAVLAQGRELLQRQGRVSYRAMKLRFNLDDEALAALKDELIYAERVAWDEEDRVLVWGGAADTTTEPLGRSFLAHTLDIPPTEPRAPESERRQLIVLFCDLVDSTVLANQPPAESRRFPLSAGHARSPEGDVPPLPVGGAVVSGENRGVHHEPVPATA